MACSSYYKFGSEEKKQKGVDNPERFLMQQGVNGVNGVNNAGITPPQPSPSGEGVLANSLQALSEGNRLTSFLPLESQVGVGNGLNPENQLSNNLPQNLPPQQNTDVVLGLINLISQVSQGKVKNTSELEELINSMEQLLEEK